MPRPSRIVELELEDVVTAGLEAGKTQRQILGDLNEELRFRHGDSAGRPATITDRGLERYIARVRKDTAELVHTPRAARENAAWSVNVGRRIEESLSRVEGWLSEVDAARLRDSNGADAGPDWNARARIMAENTRLLDLTGKMLERIYNAEQIRVFQTVVMDTIRDADEETARRIEAKLREASSTRAAALLGVAA